MERNMQKHSYSLKNYQLVAEQIPVSVNYLMEKKKSSNKKTKQKTAVAFLDSLICQIFFTLPSVETKMDSRCRANLPWAPNMVALTVDKIFSCVPMVGIRSQTCRRHCKQIECYEGMTFKITTAS